MAVELFHDGEHACLMFNDLVDGSTDAVQANQFLIVSNGEGALIDPSGNMTYNGLVVGMGKYFHYKKLKYLLASHQDPDIVGSLNKWMMATDATLYVSTLWSRFVPHFCTMDRTAGRIEGIPDQGMRIRLGQDEIIAVPAHFLHAEGNFQFYDVRSRILFSGDMGASLVPHDAVTQPIITRSEFDAHVPYMKGFHQRYMVSSKVCRYWVNMVRQMDVSAIVPQHGRWFKGQAAVSAFLEWIEGLECGIDDFTQQNYTLPR